MFAWIEKISTNLMTFFKSLYDLVSHSMTWLFTPSSIFFFSCEPCSSGSDLQAESLSIKKTYQDRLKELDGEIPPNGTLEFVMSDLILNDENKCLTLADSDLTYLPIAIDAYSGYTAFLWGLIDLVKNNQISFVAKHYTKLFQCINAYTNNAFSDAEDLNNWMITLRPEDQVHRFVARIALAPALREYQMQLGSKMDDVTMDRLKKLAKSLKVTIDLYVISSAESSVSAALSNKTHSHSAILPQIKVASVTGQLTDHFQALLSNNTCSSDANPEEKDVFTGKKFVNDIINRLPYRLLPASYQQARSSNKRPKF